MFKIHKEEIEINGKKIILETGKIARQADGAIIATCGETVVIATAVGSKNLKDLKKAKFLKLTGAGLKESHVHDVDISREAPNYTLD